MAKNTRAVPPAPRPRTISIKPRPFSPTVVAPPLRFAILIQRLHPSSHRLLP